MLCPHDPIKTLKDEIGNRYTSPEKLLRILQELQRRGLSKCDLQVHIERTRAANDVTTKCEDLEANALLALDIVTGIMPGCRLDWPTPPTHSELKPCGHCGGLGAFTVVNKNPRTWMIVCLSCDNESAYERIDREDLIKWWNNQPLVDSLRSELDRTREEADALRKALHKYEHPPDPAWCNMCNWRKSEVPKPDQGKSCDDCGGYPCANEECIDGRCLCNAYTRPYSRPPITDDVPEMDDIPF